MFILLLVIAGFIVGYYLIIHENNPSSLVRVNENWRLEYQNCEQKAQNLIQDYTNIQDTLKQTQTLLSKLTTVSGPAHDLELCILRLQAAGLSTIF